MRHWGATGERRPCNGSGKSISIAPQLSGIREFAQAEAARLRREIEERFVKTGRLEIPANSKK
jgi:hypothetical protein